jgi:hypothetical protein
VTATDRPPENTNSTGCRVLAGLALLLLIGLPGLAVMGGIVTAVQKRQARPSSPSFSGGAPSGGTAGGQGFAPPVERNDPPDVALCRGQLGALKAALMEYQNDEVFFPRNRAPRDDAFRNDIAFAYAGLVNARGEGGGKNTPYLEWKPAQTGRLPTGETAFLDPWGSPIVYREWAHVDDVLKSKARRVRTVGGRSIVDVPHDDGQFDLYSFGPNRVDEYGTGDDLTSWPRD